MRENKPLSEHRSQVLHGVARKLNEMLVGKSELPIHELRTFLKKEEHRLKLWHKAGGGGKEIAEHRTELIDILFREVFRHAVVDVTGKTEVKGLLAAAFGGYGRRELNPFSDVDITFIHEGKNPTSEMEGIITSTLMAFWDLGFKVGHASRSILGAIHQANGDMVTKTAMLESRLLAGDKTLFLQFQIKFTAACVRGKEAEYIAWRRENQEKLRSRYGGTVFLQEPNIKSGCGGLRDYQNLHWTGMFHSGASSMKRLVEEKVLRERERRALEEAYDFVLRVRTEMHYQTGRADDQLTLRLQGKVSTGLGYPQKTMIRRCEAFMRDYYSRTRAIHLITSQALGRIREERGMKTGILAKFLGKRAEPVGEFVIRDGELYPKARDIFNRDPTLMMRAFQIAQSRGLTFSAELGDLVKRRLRLVDRTFQYSKANRMMFLSMLASKGEVGTTLRRMHDLGFLGKYLPEFAPLTCLVQHEFFHRYTADEHTLLCVEKIDALLLTTESGLQRYSTIFRNLEDPGMLYLAMLLHDTGKAANTRHHAEASALAAQKVARRLQLSPDRRRILISLVDAHGELADVARSRNLDDPATVEEFAGVIRDPVILNALMVLTLADGMGTSDEGWSDWKEQLVWQLYDQTKKYLADSGGFLRMRKNRREELQKAVAGILPENFGEEIEAHFSGMPERYFQTKTADEIAEHLRLFRRFLEEGVQATDHHLYPAVAWIDHEEAGHGEVIVCGWDRDRLLERIAAALLKSGLNVLGADVFTRNDQLALDIFKVSKHRSEPLPGERDRRNFQQELEALLQAPGHRNTPEPKVRKRRKDLDEEEELPFWVSIDNAAHPTCTILEVQAQDRLGLLYQLLRAISHGGISIEAARISTERKAALDVFYIRGEEGEKITARNALLRLERRLRTAATQADAPR